MINAASALVENPFAGQPKGHARRARRSEKEAYPRGRRGFGQYRNEWVVPHRALESPLFDPAKTVTTAQTLRGAVVVCAQG
jgi:hypothetical protein